MEILTGIPRRVMLGHRGRQQFFANNWRLRRDTDAIVVSMFQVCLQNFKKFAKFAKFQVCITNQDATAYMQHELLWSPRDLDLSSNFDFILSRKSCYGKVISFSGYAEVKNIKNQIFRLY